MMTNCEKYDECRLPVSVCNTNCKNLITERTRLGEEIKTQIANCTDQRVAGCLGDAIKGRISMSGQALLQWDFMSNGFAAHSVQMPEDVVDQILRWRDQSLAPNIALDINDPANKQQTHAEAERRQ